MLTQEIVTPRVLGLSKMIDLPSNSLVFATGNNLIFAGDITRRVLPCRIDPECERPDSRKFTINLRKWVPENRGRLIGAALTILRAYHAAGKPVQAFLPYGSFEEWSGLVRSALVWLGCADLCLARESLERDDPIEAQLAAVLSLWHEAFGSTGKTAAAIAEICNQPHFVDLNRALLDVAFSARNPEGIDPKKLGKWLKRFEKRVVSGFRIEKAGLDSHAKTVLWRVGTLRGLRGFAGNVSTNMGKLSENHPYSANYIGLDEINPALPANPANSPRPDEALPPPPVWKKDTKSPVSTPQDAEEF